MEKISNAIDKTMIAAWIIGIVMVIRARNIDAEHLFIWGLVSLIIIIIAIILLAVSYLHSRISSIFGYGYYEIKSLNISIPRRVYIIKYELADGRENTIEVGISGFVFNANSFGIDKNMVRFGYFGKPMIILQKSKLEKIESALSNYNLKK